MTLNVPDVGPGGGRRIQRHRSADREVGPGKPGVGRASRVAGASVDSVSVWVESLWLTSVTFGALMLHGLLIGALHVVLRDLGRAAADDVGVRQLRTPACEMETVALLQTPGPSVTLPRSRS